jgi:diacylglycerol kinase (ATP)
MKKETPEAVHFIKSKAGLSRWLAACRNTSQGLAYGLKNEAAIREELLVLFFAVPLALILVDSPGWRLAMIVSLLVLLAVEALNTAIEITLDKISTELSTATRAAKDLGSMAVFCLLLTTVLIWTTAIIVNY